MKTTLIEKLLGTSMAGIATIIMATAMLVLCGADVQMASAADAFVPLDLRQVKVGGEIGRRIDVTINNNLLVLKIDEDFLAPFRRKASRDGYVGLGKTIEAAVRFAANTKNKKVLALKEYLVDETIKTQTPDGYIGIMAETPACGAHGTFTRWATSSWA